jgi:hypothetical protein
MTPEDITSLRGRPLSAWRARAAEIADARDAARADERWVGGLRGDLHRSRDDDDDVFADDAVWAPPPSPPRRARRANPPLPHVVRVPRSPPPRDRRATATATATTGGGAGAGAGAGATVDVRGRFEFRDVRVAAGACAATHDGNIAAGITAFESARGVRFFPPTAAASEGVTPREERGREEEEEEEEVDEEGEEEREEGGEMDEETGLDPRDVATLFAMRESWGG